MHIGLKFGKVAAVAEHVPGPMNERGKHRFAIQTFVQQSIALINLDDIPHGRHRQPYR